LYNILIEYGVPVKLVRLMKMCLNETYIKVRIGKHLSEKKGSLADYARNSRPKVELNRL
jgi:hypothetical protein